MKEILKSRISQPLNSCVLITFFVSLSALPVLATVVASLVGAPSETVMSISPTSVVDVELVPGSEFTVSAEI